MNPHLLLTYFDRISDAPDAIPRLRKFILDLAVRGKLVDRDPKDEPAAELLKRIAAEKAQRLKECTLRKEKPLPPVADDEVPFAVPMNWSWVRVGTCSLLIEYGTSVKTEHADDGIPVLKMGDIQGGQVVLGGQKTVPRHIEDLPQLFLKRFDLLYNRTNSAELVGKTGIYLGDDDAYTFASYLIRIRFFNDLTNSAYSNLAMNAPYFRETQIVPELQQQCGQANVNGSKLRSMMIPLPPLSEQHRIVAKVDELMSLCDRLATAKEDRERRRNRLVGSSLHHLKNSGTAEAHNCARFYLAHLPRLTTNAEQIRALRETILNLAVRGQLVPQDPSDESATELLKHVQAERRRLVKDGKGKRDTELPTIDVGDAPFSLPVGWTWARFPELGTFGRGKSKHRPRNDPSLFDGGTHWLIQTGDVARSNGVIATYTNTYNEVGLAQSLKWPKGTLCITIAANIADSGILSFDACFPDSVVGFIPASEFPNARYFEYFIRTAKANLLEFAPATAQKNINLEILNAVLVPLPPLAEQCRIVAKVDELMALCDRLEAQLATAQTESRRLLDAILNEALNDIQTLDNKRTVSNG
jgi:type I restriction enzyme S subunit